MLLAGGFAGISFVTARVLNPPRPTKAKVSPYECGIVDQVPPPERFPVRFYLVAMIFIVFGLTVMRIDAGTFCESGQSRIAVGPCMVHPATRYSDFSTMVPSGSALMPL